MRLACLLLFIPFFANASDSHFYRTVNAESVEVITPAKLLLTTRFNGATELAQMTFYLEQVDFNGKENSKCNDATSQQLRNECNRLSNFFENKEIKFKLNDNTEAGEFTGEIYVNGINLQNHMIREGWYKFNYRNSRSKYLVIIQQKAKCLNKGIWKTESLKRDIECNI